MKITLTEHIEIKMKDNPPYMFRGMPELNREELIETIRRVCRNTVLAFDNLNKAFAGLKRSKPE